MSTTPGLAETLHRDWQKAARFYARFGIDEAQFRRDVPAEAEKASAGVTISVSTHLDAR